MAETKCYVIVPFFANTKEIEQQNQRKWHDWFYSPKTQKNFSERDVVPIEKQAFIGQREINKNTGEEYVIIDPLRKGTLIRGSLEKAHSDIKVVGYAIVIDGDGDIPFDYIFAVLDVIKEDRGTCLACRKGDFGMTPERGDAERFELNLIENVLKVSLPDGQCGCWGLHLTNLPKLKLSAMGFEIELDILISTLKSEISLTYVPVILSDIAKQSPSSFRPEDHRRKLEFLMEKLNLTRSTLLAYYEMFKAEYGKKLNADYEQILGDMKAAEVLVRKLPKCAEKTKCDRCDIKNN